MVDFSGVAVAMQKLNKKLKEISKIFCKELEKLNKNQEKTKYNWSFYFRKEIE